MQTLVSIVTLDTLLGGYCRIRDSCLTKFAALATGLTYVMHGAGWRKMSPLRTAFVLLDNPILCHSYIKLDTGE